jgi:amino acid adenylation domain-containing protein
MNGLDPPNAGVRPSQTFTAFSREETEQTLPERFKRQVQHNPDRLAVKTPREQWSYADLDAMSNRLAHAVLNACGEGRDAVALLVEHGASVVAAVLGVLKAGRPYVGLDPSHAHARLAHVLADCTPELILTDSPNLARATQLAGTALPTLALDTIDRSLSGDDPALSRSPDASAYVYYTSGSTGVPKGVVDHHRNVLHNVMRYTNSLRIGADDRLTLLQPVAFSGSVSSLFCALLNGAACFPFDVRRGGIGDLASWMVEQEITVYHSVPALFQRLVEAGGTFPSLRVIRLEGDVVSRHHVDLFKKRFDRRCTLVNGLGATETGLSRQYFVQVDTEIPGDVVPVGYPVEDVQAMILDESGTEVAPGEIGEIVVKSCHLAVGYWRRPELTAARFQPDPAGGPERTYRTGDAGRIMRDGCLELLGRMDHSLKLRGRWVDTRAIEAALTRLDHVTEAVVVAKETPTGDRRLAAYVVPSAWPGPTAKELAAALTAREPDLDAPLRFVLLRELPLDANGKVDRGRLPDPFHGRAGLDPGLTAPRSATEEALAGIWRDALELDEIGIDDDFFDLGGDSLQALAIVVGVEKRLGAKLPPSALLESPSIAAMARLLDRSPSRRCLVAIQPGGARRPLFCIHSGDGGVLGYRGLARRLGPDRPVFALQARGLDGERPPFSRVEEMAAHYLDEIRSVQAHGPYLLGGSCFGGIVAFEMAQQLVARGERVECLVLMDTAHAFGRVAFYVDHVRRLMRRLSRETPRGRISALLDAARRRVKKSRDPVVVRHERARMRYRPRRYEGAAVLVCPGPPHNQLGWKDCVGGGLQVIELPLLEEGREIVEPPYVGPLAKVLVRLFEESETPRPRSNSPRGDP